MKEEIEEADRPGVLVGVTGNARVGKDTLAGHLMRNYGFERVGMADPMKRFCKQIFNFTSAQLYGDDRDKPDRRYPRKQPGTEIIDGFLTPRFALQTLGTEWGRNCYNDIWIEYAVNTALALLKGDHIYVEDTGLVRIDGRQPPHGVVFSDLRFKNEFDVIKKAGGVMVRVYRDGYDGSVGIAGHASESEQKDMPDSEFHYIIHNPPGLENYYRTIDNVLRGELIDKLANK